MKRDIIAIVGDAGISDNEKKYRLAYEAGKALIDNGFRVQSGGLNGIMKAAFMGARDSNKYKEGDTIAILPGFDPGCANEFADIIVPTGLDVYRNVIVANASAVVAIGGGAGTLSEVSMAWALGRMIIGYTDVDGWSAKLAGAPIDQRKRYENIENDMVYPAKDAGEMIALIKKHLASYNKYHKGIAYIKQQ
ncbi:MAG: acyl-CoA synthetase [Christensenellales bacterium]|jgi:uncharacterized protein (TIGR00725 family)